MSRAGVTEHEMAQLAQEIAAIRAERREQSEMLAAFVRVKEYLDGR